jgi:hypothetical protein
LKFNQKPYSNAGIFFTYIRTILSPYIDTFRRRAVLAEEIALLFVVYCSADLSDDLIRVLIEARVRIITFAPHTTQVFQVLDLALFGVLKRCTRYELPFDENNATVRVITKVYHNFTQTIARPNIFGRVRERARIQEPRSVEFPLDQLSGRRRIAHFALINKPE